MKNNAKYLIANEILLRRKSKVIIPQRDADEFDPVVGKMVLAFAKNIESLGFAFSHDVISNLMRYSRDEISIFYQDLLPVLKRLCATDVQYRPMYPNFPSQVADADSWDLFLNAFVHYLSAGHWLPEYQQDDRFPLLDKADAVIITRASEETDELMQIFTNLLVSKTSLSDQDKRDVKSIMKSRSDYFMFLPKAIPLKENVAFLSSLVLEVAPIKSAKFIQPYFSTATDVLRLIVSLSDGDISLAKPTQFRKFKRPERRLIMDLLAGLKGNIIEDMYRYQYEWLRVGEILHTGEYASKRKYARVVTAFDRLRNLSKPLMFAGKVKESIKSGNVMAAAKLLLQRPGEFARSLDKLLRDADDVEMAIEITDMFDRVAKQVSSPVLLQVRQHFTNRLSDGLPVRVFFPKGQLSKAVCIPNELPGLDENACINVIESCNRALTSIYAKDRPALGKVYIHPDFKNFIVPFSQRSATSGSKILVRGSRIPIKPDAKTIRAFIWWTNTSDKEYKNPWDGMDDRVDIDLSAAILDDEFSYVTHVSYTNLREGNVAYHSGDIVNGGPMNGKGAAEFIDIDIDAAAKKGRYICFQMYNYTCQKYASLPNCRFGWMEREYPNSGEIFEPSTVRMYVTPQSNSTVCVPVLFDCVERKFIWMDMSVDMARFNNGGNNLESNISKVQAICQSIVNIGKANLYDLIMLNVNARGSLATDRNDADIIFDNDLTKPKEIRTEIQENGGELQIVQSKDVPIITAFDIDYFMGQML